MSSVHEMEPKLEKRAEAPSSQKAPADLTMYERPLFCDSLLEGVAKQRRQQGVTTLFSFVVQSLLIAIVVVVPLMYTESLPTRQLLTFLVAPPPPPPPPPPPAAAPPIKIVKTTELTDTGKLRTPTKIPQKVEMINEQAPPTDINAGVVGGVPGGIPGGQAGGVIGGIISSTAALNSIKLPPPPPPKRIRVSQGVTSGLLVRRVEPSYPPLARAARIQGQVILSAIIDKSGNITNLQVVSGHPMLVPSAIDAVKQWRYRPYLLNGEPTEVETTVIVNFQLAG